MTLRKRARTTAGFLAVVTLLALVVADTLYQGVTLTGGHKFLLVALISALLGVDIAVSELVTLETSSEDDTDDQ